MTSIDPASRIPGMAPIHPAVRVGHVHLRVADLERSIAFYRDGLGFGVVADGRAIGLDAAFLAAGDYHHHVGLNTWESAGALAAAAGAHRALPRRLRLPRPARARPRRPAAARPRHAIDHATDHSATVSVYLEDPDGNGVELYYDRPRKAWFDERGSPILKAERIPVDGI